MTIGDRFTVRTGPRRMIYAGDFHYFQKRNHRYLCRIVDVRHERFRYRRTETRLRCVAQVEVVAPLITDASDR